MAGCDDRCHMRAGEAQAAGRSTEEQEGAAGLLRGSSPTPPLHQEPSPYLLLYPPRSPGSVSPPRVQSYSHNCPTGVKISTNTSLLEDREGEFKKMPF